MSLGRARKEKEKKGGKHKIIKSKSQCTHRHTLYTDRPDWLYKISLKHKWLRCAFVMYDKSSVISIKVDFLQKQTGIIMAWSVYLLPMFVGLHSQLCSGLSVWSVCWQTEWKGNRHSHLSRLRYLIFHSPPPSLRQKPELRAQDITTRTFRYCVMCGHIVYTWRHHAWICTLWLFTLKV